MNKQLTDEEKIIDILVKAIKLGIEALPDSRKWKYCWDEMTDEEQEEVKRVAAEMDKALKIQGDRQG